ncbi:phage holin family protein [Streptomyces hypolithicus]
MPESADPSAAELVKRASEQVSELVREELRLAGTEMKMKGKKVGLGGGLFTGVGLTAFLALQALVATAFAALAVALPVWAAGLIVTGVLTAVAAVLALLGRSKTRAATPLAPEEAARSVKTDIQTIKESASR